MVNAGANILGHRPKRRIAGSGVVRRRRAL
jgi:hypothetical protein